MLLFIVREFIVVYLIWENLEMLKDLILYSEIIFVKEVWVIIWNEILFIEILIENCYKYVYCSIENSFRW